MMQLPVDKTEVTMWFGQNGHGGIDFAWLIKYATGIPVPILAAEAGKVTQVVNNLDRDMRTRGYGNQVVIDHGNGIKTRYAHLAKGSVRVKVGQVVPQGHTIGIMGNTGYSFGRHLHFEVIKNGVRVNPKPYLRVFPHQLLQKGGIDSAPVVAVDPHIEEIKQLKAENEALNIKLDKIAELAK